MTDEEAKIPTPLLAPAQGLPDVINTEELFEKALISLAQGAGPFALDAERASGYKFSARAYLIQIARDGGGLHLIDPIPFGPGHRLFIRLNNLLATGRMGVVSPISAMSGVVPVLYALFYLDEQLSPLVTVGVIFALLGAILASGPEFSQGFPLKPVFLALGAALGFGTALTFMAQGSESSALMTMVSMRAATFFVSVAILVRLRGTGGMGKSHVGLLVFIGVADFSANLILGIATTKGLVSLAMVLGSLFPIVTSLLAFIFLKERLHRVQYAGIASAVFGVAMIGAFSKQL